MQYTSHQGYSIPMTCNYKGYNKKVRFYLQGLGYNKYQHGIIQHGKKDRPHIKCRYRRLDGWK